MPSPQGRPDDDDNAFDAFLEAALRGESTEGLEADFRDDQEASPEIREAILGLGRILRGDGEPTATSKIQSSPDLPLETLGEFRLIRQIGAGGMGVVYLAEQPSLGRLVALKVLRPERAGSEAEVRFRREMQAVAQLNHPNIVAVFANGEERGVSYLAMELVPGRGLDELVTEARERDERLSIQQVARWGAQIASALNAAHAEGFLHRDVKPSNVRIHKDGRAMLLDFGLARKIDSRTFTTTGAMTGSPYYASPEQIGGPRTEVSAASDVYSLGVTLYECVTGQVPFEADEPARLLHLILTAEPTPPRRLRPDLPYDLETVILCAMERNASRRYPSARALQEDLEAVLDLRTIAARSAGAVTRMVKLARRNLPATIALSAVTLVLVVVVMLQISRELSERREFRHHLEQARAEQRAGDFNAALTAVDQALGLREEDPEATLLRLEVERARERAAAGQARARARRLILDFGDRAAGRAAARDAVRAFEPKQYLRWLYAEEREKLDQARWDLKRIERGFEEARFQVEDAINSAAVLGNPERPEPLKAELYLELWRIADRTGDVESRELYRRIIEENDPEGRHAAVFHMVGHLALRTDPPGTEVHLFRYESLTDLDLEGEERLVPVPLDRLLPTAPGAVVLRVAEDRAPLRRGDLILSVEGRPVTTNFLVNDGELTDEYLAEIDGRPVPSADFLKWEPYERILSQEVRNADLLEPVEHVFEREGERTTHRIRVVRDLGLKVLNAREAIRRYGTLFGQRYRNGVVEEVELPAGTVTHQTATPLFASPSTLAGVTPIEDIELEQGSYVALLRHPDGCEVRRPFMVRRGEKTEIGVDLPEKDQRPVGMTYVPGGMFRAGGDPLAPFGVDAQDVVVAPFWIGETEVTMGEYARFLNDPENQAGLGSVRELELVPAAPLPSNAKKFWHRDSEGLWQPPGGIADHPVFALTWIAADAYVQWLNRTSLARDSDWEYGLPTELEWEKASRGVDARAFPFGDAIDPRWIRSRFSRIIPIPENVNSYPVDESPYGVFDMCGNMMEWSSEIFSKSRRNLMLLKGGSWGLASPADFRNAKRVGEPIDEGRNMAGLRIVLRMR